MTLTDKRFDKEEKSCAECILLKNIDELGSFRIAKLLAKQLILGDIILLNGSIGSGKTHFARSFIYNRLLPYNLVEDIPSPTFTIVQVYDTISPPIWHVDLYRVSSENEIVELGLDSAFETAISLIEWPDRLGRYMPLKYILISIEQSDFDLDSRDIRIQTFGNNWRSIMTILEREFL